MTVLTCNFCGLTNDTNTGMFFYLVDDIVWCDTHLPPEIKKMYESI